MDSDLLLITINDFDRCVIDHYNLDATGADMEHYAEFEHHTGLEYVRVYYGYDESHAYHFIDYYAFRVIDVMKFRCFMIKHGVNIKHLDGPTENGEKYHPEWSSG